MDKETGKNEEREREEWGKKSSRKDWCHLFFDCSRECRGSESKMCVRRGWDLCEVRFWMVFDQIDKSEE
jgi:hypothetical protein